MWIDQRGSEILQWPECLQLLALAAKEDRFGRLAVTDGGSPLVVPHRISTFHDRALLVRIGQGRMRELVPGSLVAFEVDRVEQNLGLAWSVLVRGLASVLAPDDALAAHAPTPWVPEPGEEVISIRPDVVTGRRFRLVASVAG